MMNLIFLLAVVGEMLTVCMSVGQNAILNATVTESNTVTLICQYIGAGNENFIMWRNGSSFDVLTLRSDCSVFGSVTSSYDPHRTSLTCDAENNIYTLKISPLKTVDDNVTWSCAFQDPSTPDQWATTTISLTETSGDIDSRGADGGTSSHLFYLGIFVGIIVIVLVLFAGLYFWKKRTCKHDRPRGIKNTIKGIFCPNQPDQDENVTEHELEEMNPKHNTY